VRLTRIRGIHAGAASCARCASARSTLWANGDPVNYSDPFGDSVKINGAALNAAICAVRARSPGANAAFTKLENDPRNFLFIERDKQGYNTLGYGGRTGTSYADYPGSKSFIPEDLNNKYPRNAGISIINPQTAASNNADLGDVAWHEAVHLTGVVDRGKLYQHDEPAFAGVPPNATTPHTTPQSLACPTP
jgi:hypothetical protein